MASTTDAAGFTRNYGYDLAGRVVKESYLRTLSDATQVTEGKSYRYDLLGRVTYQAAVTLGGNGIWSAGDRTVIGYNTFGEISGRGIVAGGIYASSNVTAVYQEKYEYDATGRMWRSNAGDGVAKLYVNDANGRATLTITSAGTDLTNLSVNDALALLTVNNTKTIGEQLVAGVNATITVYDSRGQTKQILEPKRETSAIGVGTTAFVARSWTYNAFGEVVTETDAANATTAFAYNTMGKLVSKTGPSVSVTNEKGVAGAWAAVETYDYDLSGRLISVIDANANYIRAKDTSSNPAPAKRTSRVLLGGTGYGGSDAKVMLERRADGSIAETGYDVFGDARTLTNGVATEIEKRDYDAMGRLIKIIRPSAQLTEYYQYDGLGQRTAHWNSVFSATVKETTDYDRQGRVVQSIDYLGYKTTYTYVFTGTTATTGLGTFGAWLRTTKYWTGVMEADGVTPKADDSGSSETSDYFGHLISRADRGKHTFNYEYDSAGRLVHETSSKPNSTLSRDVSYTYYNTGRLASIVDASNNGSTFYSSKVTSTFQYDVAGRRTYEKYAEVLSPTSSIVRQQANVTYDILGRMLSYIDNSVSSQPVKINYEYDAGGNVRRVKSEYYSTVVNPDNPTNPYQWPADYWYSYDSMNRFTTVKGQLVDAAGGGKIVGRGTTGTDISYDLAGRRASATSGQSAGVSTETYTYGADGYLTKVDLALGGNPIGKTVQYVRDKMGRVTQYFEYKVSYVDSVPSNTATYFRKATYNARNDVTHDEATTYFDDGASQKIVTDYEYRKLQADGTYDNGIYYGAVTRAESTVTRWSAAGNQQSQSTDLTTSNYSWWDDARLESTLRKITNSTTPNQSSYSGTWMDYDQAGHLAQAGFDENGDLNYERKVKYTTDASGKVLTRTDDAGPKETYYYFDGVRVGDVGNDGSADPVDYAAALNQRTAVTQSSAWRYGAPKAFSDFDQNYQAIVPTSQAGTAGRYTVNEGDTLQSIANAVWGDANLWYLLAEANGLTNEDILVRGQSVSIPNKVANAHNTSDTFKPYDPNKAIGDVSAPQPAPPKADKGGCGVVGQIIMVVVAVVVAIYAPYLVPVLGQMLASGGILTVVAAGAIIGAAASVVSQGVGLAIGAIDKFSWNAVAMGAISGAVGAGLNSVMPTQIAGSSTLADVARGAAGSVITQGVGVATGLQSKFDWTGVAVAGVISGVSGAAGRGLNDTGVSWLATDSFANDAFSGLAGGAAGAATRSLVDGSNFGDNLVRAIPDIIGSTVGNKIGNSLASESIRRAAARSIVDDLANMTGNMTIEERRFKEAEINSEMRAIERLAFSDPKAAVERRDALMSSLKDSLRKTEAGKKEVLLAENLLRPDSVEDNNPSEGIVLTRNGVEADATYGSQIVDDVVVTGIRGNETESPLAFHPLVDAPSIQGGALVQKVGGKLNEYIDKTPGARTALTLVDWSVKISGGPVRFLVGKAYEAAEDRIVEYSTDKFKRGGYDAADASAGGIGIPVIGALAFTGVKGFLKLASGGGIFSVARAGSSRRTAESARTAPTFDPYVVEAEGALGAARVPKAINLPSWRRVGVDMEEVVSGHMAGGSRLGVNSTKDLFPEWMSQSAVKKEILDAYRYGSAVKTQGDRIKIIGPSTSMAGKQIVMWLNKSTKQIETAFPNDLPK